MELHIFFGFFGSGKSYLANKLVEEKSRKGIDSLKTSIAEPLKRLCRKFNIKKYTNRELISERCQLIEILKDDSQTNPKKELLKELSLSIFSRVTDKQSRIINLIHNLVKKDLVKALENEDLVNARKIIRDILQKVGTEFGRDILGQNYWVETFIYKVRQLKKECFLSKHKHIFKDVAIIIDDLRFENEAEFILKNAKLFDKIYVYKVNSSFETRAKRLEIPEHTLFELSAHLSESKDQLNKIEQVFLNGNIDIIEIEN